MADNVLKGVVQITAPNVKKTFDEVAAGAQKSENAIKQVAPVAVKTQAALTQLTTSSVKAGAALAKVPTSSNAATLSLTNLGRVVQDAPFGFLGIANNLNPLVESFQRLKASTGSTGGALKALGKDLTGAGGLGLAISVVSSLLILFGDKLFGTSKAAKEAEDANKKLAESIAGDIVGLTSLVAIVQNVNAKQEDRKKALQAINQEYAKYLPSLDREKITLDNIAISYERIVDAILRQAVVKGLQEEIEKAVTKTAASIITLEKAEQKRQQTTVQTARTQLSATEAAVRGADRFNQVRRDGIQASIESKNQITQEVGALNNYETALVRLKQQLKRDLSPLFDIMKNFSFDDLSVKLDKIKVEKPDDFRPVVIVDIPISPKFTIDMEKLNLVLGGGDIQTLQEKAQDRINEEISKLAKPLKLNLSAIVIANNKGTKEFADEQIKKYNALGGIINDFVTPAFQNFFDTIAKGGNAFKAFGQSVIQSLTQLITKLITAVALAAILSAVTGSVGFQGAVGFKDIFGKLLGFRAAGGPVVGGGSYIVGERGPELFTPNTGGNITPNGGVAGGVTAGGVTVAITGQFKLRGKDLVADIVLANQSNQRLIG